MMGNLTNMYAMGYGNDPQRFAADYGMMCAAHAGELTQRLRQEGRVTEVDLMEANQQAMLFMARKI
jgi:hypothetical protein